MPAIDVPIPSDDHDGCREQRHEFIRLLRHGVQAKIQQQMNADATPQIREATHTCQHPTTSDRKYHHWHTLAWRDAFSMEPLFQETINGEPLRIQQILQGELNGFGTGLTVWPAACVLLKYLEHRFALKSIDAHPRFVLELGSGTGAVGIAAAMLPGTRRVVLTDMANVLFLMQKNAAMARESMANNHADVVIDVESYEWGEQPSTNIIPVDATDSQYPDLILVSDCILPRLYPIQPLVDALTLLCKSHTTIFISYEHRYYQQFHPKQMFWELMHARGFTIRVLEDQEYHQYYMADDIEIWEVTRRVVESKASI